MTSWKTVIGMVASMGLFISGIVCSTYPLSGLGGAAINLILLGCLVAHLERYSLDGVVVSTTGASAGDFAIVPAATPLYLATDRGIKRATSNFPAHFDGVRVMVLEAR